jgi:hypothetical protein
MRRAPLLLVLAAFAALAIGADSCDTNTSSDLGNAPAKKQNQHGNPPALPPSTPKAEKPPPPAPTGNCDPNYAGACLDPSSPDYDCAGGSGDGPDYTGYVRVVGSDHYGLDADGDGVGCE